MAHSRKRCDRAHESLPSLSLLRENAMTFCGQAVETSAPLTGLLDPSPFQPAALFEPIEQRVQRRNVELDLAARLGLDELADLVAVPSTHFDAGQDDQLCGAFLQLARQHAVVYICHSHICYCQ